MDDDRPFHTWFPSPPFFYEFILSSIFSFAIRPDGENIEAGAFVMLCS
jgi:hypothetical protein